MAFKKGGKVGGKGKGKPKKKSKKGGKKDEWSHEGGMVLDGKDDENNEASTDRRRRRTQEKDESIRRGKLKGEERKRKQQFFKKMAKKVKFGEDEDVAANVESEEESETEQSAPRREVVPNPLAVMDRLKLFVSKSLQQRDSFASDSEDESEDEEDDDEEEEGDSNDEDDKSEAVESEDESQNGNRNSKRSSKNSKVQDIEDHDVAEDEDNDDEEEEADEDNRAAATAGGEDGPDFYFENMFNKPVEDGSNSKASKSKMSLLSTLSQVPYEVYGDLHFAQPEGSSSTGQKGKGSSSSSSSSSSGSNAALPVCPGPYKGVAQMPGLHKMFRCPSAVQRLNGTVLKDPYNAQVLPYIASYADAFLEGRDHHNDDAMLQGILLHLVAHTVKARYCIV
jgi:hypothetical protein